MTKIGMCLFPSNYHEKAMMQYYVQLIPGLFFVLFFPSKLHTFILYYIQSVYSEYLVLTHNMLRNPYNKSISLKTRKTFC